MAYVAYYMMKNGIQRIPEDKLVNTLLKCSEDLDGELRRPLNDKNVRGFIEELEERTCCLKEDTVIFKTKIYQFTHFNLQEYLAAYAITRYLTEDSKSALVIIKENYKKSFWRETIILIVLLLSDRYKRYEVIEFLIKEAENTENNYESTNLLFEIIANGVMIKQDLKHKIYDLLFKENITDWQIKKIVDYMEDVRSEEFKNYIIEKYKKSVCEGRSEYVYATATIFAYDYYRDGKEPLKEAELMIIQGEKQDIILGLYIIALIGWCKYSSINITFSSGDFKSSKEFEGKIHHMVLNDIIPLWEIADSIKDIMLAGYMEGDIFFDRQLYQKLINNLIKGGDIYAEMILSVFPLNYRTLSFHHLYDVNLLKTKYSDELKTKLEVGAEAKEVVFIFAVCIMLGCWAVTSNELINQFTDIDVYYSENEKYTDDAALYRLRKLRIQIPCLINAISDGVDYYKMGDINSSKEAFIVAFGDGNIIAANNLAYLLRRKEIDSVIINNKEYTVMELLKPGILLNEAFAIVNYALVISLKGGVFDYEKGFCYIMKLDFKMSSISNVLDWWSNLAESGELEGYIVIAWLLEAGLIQTSKFGDLETLKRIINSKLQ